MGWIITILVGWLASIIMKTNAQQGAIANILVGIVGSLLGRWLFSDVLQIGGAVAAGSFSLLGLLWGIIGAVVLIAILKALNIFK